MKKDTVNIIDQRPLTEQENNGWLISYEIVYDQTTVSTEREQEVWIDDYDKARKEFLKNFKNK